MTAEKFEDFDEANALDDKPKAQESEKPKEDPKPAEAAKSESGEKSDGDDAKQWQSKADKAEARANKAEAELDRLKRAQTVEENPRKAAAASGNSGDLWVAASKENFRDDLFRSDQRLDALGFSPDLIQGSTPAEMRQSFVSLQGTVDRMETGIRNQVLVEHGLQPVPGSGERATGVNYRTMPTDDFMKEVDKALQG